MIEHLGRRIRAGMAIALLLVIASALLIRPAGAALSGFHIRRRQRPGLCDARDQPRPHLVSAADQLVRQHQGRRRQHHPRRAEQRRPLDPQQPRGCRQCDHALQKQPTTGYGEDGAATTLARATDYWITLKDTLAGQEAYVILNIGNEPFGNSNPGQWTQATKDAVVRLRAAGFAHTIMVDAPNWGQDWAFTMRDHAAEVFAADPNSNLIFSIHMYGVFDTAAEIESYLKAFTTAKLPILVGEFGYNHSDGNPDEDAIMSWAQTLGVGYLGWSWSGNGGGVEYLDMVSGFNPASLTTWGQRLINGANGLKATSREASVFGGPVSTATSVPPTIPPTSGPTVTIPPSTNTPTPRPTNTPGPTATPTGVPPLPTITPTPGSGACQVTYAIPNQWNDGFLGDVTVKNTGAAITGWTLTWSFGGTQRITNLWNGVATQSGQAVSVRNADWNGSLASGGTVNFGFQGTYSGANAKPTVFKLNGVLCSTQ
jgi:mannan endo-1,4-beta-mannosidase